MQNENIILAGRQPDLVNTLNRANVAAAGANQIHDQNALRQLYQTQGAEIAAGNPQALNALAALNPQAALDVRNTQNVISNRDARTGIMQASERRAAEEYARSLSAAERQQQAAEAERELMTGISMFKAGDLPGLNALMQSIGEPPLASLEEFPARAVKYKGVIDALVELKDFEAGPKETTAMQTLRARAEAAGLKEGSPEYAEFMRAGGKTEPTRVVRDADGNVVYAEGAAAIEPPKMTVDAAKNTGFLIRTIDANEVLNELETQGLRFWQQNAEHVPFNLGNYFRDSDFQKFDQAKRDFVNAILRRESGAVISDQEFDNADKQYFPIPGDGPEVIAQKRQNRINAIAGLRAGSGPGAAYADQLDASQPEPPASTPEVPDQRSPQPAPQFQFETEDQKALFEKYAVPSDG